MSAIRVLYLTTDLQKGGLPLRLCNLVRRFSGTGIEPVVGCLAARGPLHDVLDDAGIETFHCDAQGGWDARCLAEFSRVVRRFNPDLIHASLFHANLAARLCGRMDRSRPIVTSTVTIEVERRWHRRIEALTCRLSDVHVGNSSAVVRHLIDDLGFPPGLVRVIPNGIDIAGIDEAPPMSRASFGIRNDLPLMVWAGRMDPVKNLETLIEAVGMVRRERAIQLALIGDGPARGRIQLLVERRGLASLVRFVGWSDNVAGWLKSADMLVFPSRTEGCPNVVLEAMAARCPIVASRIPAHESLFGASGAARLCAWNDARSYVGAIRRVLDDDRRPDAMAAGRRIVEQFHAVDASAAAWRRCYQDLMG